MTNKSKHNVTRVSKKKGAIPSSPQEIDIIHNPPKLFIILLVVVAIVSFLLGCIARLCFVSHALQCELEKEIYGRTLPSTFIKQANGTLPAPKLLSGKRVPLSKYSSKVFPPVSVATATCDTVHLEPALHDHCVKPMTTKDFDKNTEVHFMPDPSCNHWKPMTMKCTNHTPVAYMDTNVDSAVHYPSGQHLVSDIMCHLNSLSSLAVSLLSLPHS